MGDRRSRQSAERDGEYLAQSRPPVGCENSAARTGTVVAERCAQR
uniref:Uncharacterized protein n=1 Tax=Arundo donax TaxID=35708 RepID=A0A0A9AQB6_ARUDO